MLGAAVRLDPSDGTLHVNPTIQSVELFSAKGYTVMTIKASAPLRPGGALMGTMDSPPKVYFDFQGYSMGFDAFNSTGERIVSAGLGSVEKARAGMFESFPDKTRVVLDLKSRMNAVVQPLPDKTLFAIVLVPPGRSAAPERDECQTASYGPEGSVARHYDCGGCRSWRPRFGRTRQQERGEIAYARYRQALAQQSGGAGATVLMTRETDNFISLQGRVDFANSRRRISSSACTSIRSVPLRQARKRFSGRDNPRRWRAKCIRNWRRATGYPISGVFAGTLSM
jgi:hypothetical protein